MLNSLSAIRFYLMNELDTRDLLYTVLTANSEKEAKEVLHEAISLQDAAGAMFFRIKTINEDLPPEISTFWDKDFSGLLKSSSPHDVMADALNQAPLWLIRWLSGRSKPLWFNAYTKYIPFSSAALLRITSADGAPPLGDFVLIPQKASHGSFFLFVGLHHRLNQEQARHISELGAAYVNRALVEITLETDTNKESKHFKLSEKQLECLRWMAVGKSLQETAIITGMSYANVRYHLEKAKRESKFTSMQQLLVYAARSYDLSPLTNTPNVNNPPV